MLHNCVMKGGLVIMRGAITFDRHVGRPWLHFAIRLEIILLLIILFLVITQKSIGKPVRRELTTVEVLEAEQRLSELGYWTGEIDGNFDDASKHALIAFQKIEGRKRTGKLTPPNCVTAHATRTRGRKLYSLKARPIPTPSALAVEPASIPDSLAMTRRNLYAASRSAEEEIGRAE
jgi:hypothetical protein